MIRFVYGPAGSGKSACIYNQIIDDLKNGKKPILVVPDQNILSAERRLVDSFDGVSGIDVEVLSFRRLSDYVFRLVGGLAFNNIDEGGLLIIMWRVLREVSPFLKNYGNVDDKNTAFAELMYNTVKELKQFSVTPYMLSVASERIKDTHRTLSDKLQDIALIYGTFQSFVSKEYNDPSDELTRLAMTLKENNVFFDNTVYFDAFDGFTPQQYLVLKEISEQAENVTFSLCYDPTDNSGVFGTTEKTYSSLRKLAGKLNIKTEDLYLNKPISYKSEAVKYIAKNLWDHNVSSTDYNGDSNGVNTYCCHDAFSECEFIVSDIQRRIRQGARFKDILVIAGNINSYEGIIDTELENNSIPYFMSRRTDLKSKPIFKLILAAFSVINKNWRYNDVISLIKTGLAGISYEECDILENYVSVWNINGRRWYDGIDWNMNPDGFVVNKTDEGYLIISRANEIRNRIVTHLLKLNDSVGKTTVAETTEALYNFLCNLNVKEQIEKKAAECRNEKRFAEEKELIQLWNILINIFDTIVDIVGDMVLSGEEYCCLLDLILGKADIGIIPPGIDQVILGSASNLRAENVEHVYLLGVNDGVFPKNAEENSIFNDVEKNLLRTLDVDLNGGTDEQTVDELYWFYRAVSRAKTSLTVVYSESDLKGASNKISVAGSRINYLLNDKEIIKYDELPAIDKVEGKNSALKLLALNRNNETGEALLNFFKNDSEISTLVSSYDEPLTAGETSIIPELSKEIYKGNISTTQTKVDSYVNCPFNYHCTHILRLKETKKAAIRNNDIGTFVHEVLEKFISRISNEEGIDTGISDEEVVALVKEIISEYLNNLFSDISELNPRLVQLFKRLERTTLLLARSILDEFKQSDFIPSFFELPIMPESDKGLEPYEITLDDGTKLYMRGYVDRVDTYKKGKDVYIRIIDYKTGSKTFSLEDVEKGLNLQMFLYLFAVWNTKKEWFRNKIRCDGEIIPAGVLYFSAKAPGITIENEDDIATVYEKAQSGITRKGVLLNDIDVLRAMDKKLEGMYIPVKLYKKGTFSNSDYLKTVEEFGLLCDKIENILKGIAKNMKEGNVSAKPLTVKRKAEPCLYCKMRPICRHMTKGDEDE